MLPRKFRALFAELVAELGNSRKRGRTENEQRDTGSKRHKDRLRQGLTSWPGETEQDRHDREHGEEHMLDALRDGGEVQV